MAKKTSMCDFKLILTLNGITASKDEIIKALNARVRIKKGA